jgi:hypothetical protein
MPQASDWGRAIGPPPGAVSVQSPSDMLDQGHPLPAALRFPTRPGGLAAGPPPSCLLGWTYVERDSALLSVPIGVEQPAHPS